MPGGGHSTDGPTPWWQLPQYNRGEGGSTLANLQRSAPQGYEYDPVAMQYQRTPQSAGGRAGAYMSAALGGIPSLAGLFGQGGAGGAGGTGGFGIGGGTGTGGGGTGGGPSAGPTLTLPDQSQAASAAFARAKDQAGQMTRASLDSLAGELGGQGMLGGGAQYQGTADILSRGTNLMGEASRSQAGKEADLAADFAKTRYQGDITQRGQNIQAQEAQARLALESRQQIFDLLKMALGGLGGYGGGLSTYGGSTGGTAKSAAGGLMY